MITKTAEEKIVKFYKIIEGMQSGKKKEPAILVVKKENLGDVAALAPNSNLVTVIDLQEGTDAEEVIGQLADAMKSGRVALLCLHRYLDPKIYNQLYLLAQDGHMEYPHLEERMFVDAVKDARVIIVSTDAELEKLNYSNIFDLAAVVERI
jgi:hypothetical protein